MIEKPEHGALYWCIRPDIESENYGQGGPRRPWLGRLRIDEKSGMMYLSGVGPAPEYEADEDSNATAHVKPPDLYPTELDALGAWIEETEACVLRALDNAVDMLLEVGIERKRFHRGREK